MDDLTALLPKLNADNLDERKAARERFEDVCTNAARPGAEEERAAAAKAVVGLLGGDLSLPVRVWLLRELWLIGGAEAVPALAGHLGQADEETRDAARRALQKNPSTEAVAALVAGLKDAKTPAVRVAMLNALGARLDASLVAGLVPFLTDAAPEAGTASAAALGRIGGPEAAKALAAAQAGANAVVGPAVGEARLQCAQQFLLAGQPDDAEAIYKDLAAAGAEPLRLAARHGLEAVALTRKSGRPEFPPAAPRRGA